MSVKTEKKQRSSNLFLNMILKWDEPIEMVRRSISSIIEYVDSAYITITFPDDNFKKNTPLEKVLKKEFNANISYFKWVDDFSVARNFALAQVPNGRNNFIYWQDADDILQGAEHLHDISDIAATYSHAAVFFHYWYVVDLDENGNVRNVVVDQVRERIIRNDGTFKWIGMLHETLIEQKQENVMKVNNDKCTVVHISSDGKRMDTNIERNIRILEKGAKIEKRKDPRTLVYLAKAYVDKGKMTSDLTIAKINFDLALTLFDEYLEGCGKPGTPGYQEGSGWPQERATAWGYIADVAVISRNYLMAIESLQNAINEAPEFPNYYVDLAMVYSIMGDFKKAKHWLTVATSMESPKTTIVQTPRDFMTRALEVGYQVGMNMGNLDLAKESSEKLIEIYPTLPDYQKRLESVEGLIKANKISQSIVFLGKILEETKDKEKLKYLVRAIPEDLKQEKFASEMRHLFLPPQKWKSNEIAILCGPGYEQWTPDSLKTGLGGSEEAVVYLSRELKKLGWKVTVYAHPGSKYGDHDGIKYLQWYDFNVKDDFNVLVLWRVLGFVDFKPKSKFTMVWYHDVPNCADITKERLSQVNKLAVLSEYHKGLFRVAKEDGTFEKIPEEKMLLTSNGIANLEVPRKNKRDPYRMIYSSSLDRGLIYLLEMWPEIIKEVPQANLHVYYGFDIFDKMYPDNPGKQKWKNMVLGAMKQKGITYHGRVGHDELHKAMAESALWAYPTDFDEISCCVGDTPILMPRDHKKHPYGVPIKELVGKSSFYVYSYDHETDKIVLGKVKWVKITRKNAKLLRITLDDGTVLRFTPDHKFLLRNGKYKEAKDLIVGDSLMPCYEKPTFAIKQTNGKWENEHRMVAETLWGDEVKGKMVDHKNRNRYDNTPDNLRLLTPSEHTRKIANEERVITDVGRKRMSDAQIELSKTPERIKFFSKLGTLRANKFWDTFRTWPIEKQKEWTTNRQLQKNHSVIDICDDLVREDVYDMEVEKYHTFAAGGVFVHNCITAMKCQALGAIPVVVNRAALKETVKNGMKIDVDISTKEGQKEYLKQLIRILKSLELQEEIRPSMIEWARDYFTWDKVAQKWDREFRIKTQNPELAVKKEV